MKANLIIDSCTMLKAEEFFTHLQRAARLPIGRNPIHSKLLWSIVLRNKKSGVFTAFKNNWFSQTDYFFSLANRFSQTN